MNILAIDTSSNSGSIAIYTNGKIAYISYLNILVTHSERLMPQIDLAFKHAKITPKQINCIAVSIGPGSFTGIRIGLATAKGLAFGLKVPIIAISTLKMQAASLYGNQHNILCFNDARMNEIYAAMYSPDLKEIIKPQNAKPDEFIKQLSGSFTICGDGYNKYKHLFEGLNVKHALIHQNTALASALISLVFHENEIPEYNEQKLALLEPEYLRKSQAELNHCK